MSFPRWLPCMLVPTLLGLGSCRKSAPPPAPPPPAASKPLVTPDADDPCQRFAEHPPRTFVFASRDGVFERGAGGLIARRLSGTVARHVRQLPDGSYLLLVSGGDDAALDINLAQGFQVRHLLPTGERTVAKVPAVPSLALAVQSESDVTVEAGHLVMRLSDRNENMADATLGLRIRLSDGALSGHLSGDAHTVQDEHQDEDQNERQDPTPTDSEPKALPAWITTGDVDAAPPPAVVASKPSDAPTDQETPDACFAFVARASEAGGPTSVSIEARGDIAPHTDAGAPATSFAGKTLNGWTLDLDGRSPSGRYLVLRGNETDGDYIHAQLVLLDRLRGVVFPLRKGKWPAPFTRAGLDALKPEDDRKTASVVGETLVRWFDFGVGNEALLVDDTLYVPHRGSTRVGSAAAR